MYALCCHFYLLCATLFPVIGVCTQTTSDIQSYYTNVKKLFWSSEIVLIQTLLKNGSAEHIFHSGKMCMYCVCTPSHVCTVSGAAGKIKGQ